MSQTILNRTSQLKASDAKAHSNLASFQTVSHTKATSEIKIQANTQYDDKNLNTKKEALEEFTSDDIKEFEKASKELRHENVHNQDYENKFTKIRENLEKTMSSNLPLSIKIKMMESAMEQLKTNIDCVKETNSVLKQNIISIDKLNDSQSQIKSMTSSNSKDKGTTKDFLQAAKHSSLVKPGLSKTTPVKGKTANEASVKQPIAVKAPPPMTENEKLADELAKETKRLEETIAHLKQTRNILSVSLEDLKDDIEDMQGLLKEKKQSLDRKINYAEDLKQRISQSSSKRSISKSGGHRKTGSEASTFSLKSGFFGNNGEKATDVSTSRIETSMLQEVSSKIGNVFGRMGKVFGLKKEEKTDNILGTLGDYDAQSMPVSLNNSRVSTQRGMHMSIGNLPFK